MSPTILLLLALVPTWVAAQTPADAAKAVAAGPLCAPLAPFYWEIGTASGVLTGGAQQAGRLGFTRDSAMPIASASKWIYGAYVDQVKKGFISSDDAKYLNLRSGWSRFDQCASTDTVASCAANAGYVKRTDGKFAYGGGHMQKHAAFNGLQALNSVTLATKVNATLGTGFEYTSPQLAGGVRTSAAQFATMLQKLMRGDLYGGNHLADNAVPTQGPEAISSPVPEPWQYGRGHWIELDGTFSSPGAFGFYPWISADKRLYGVLARQAVGGAWDSVQCGRAIRKAYTGGS